MKRTILGASLLLLPALASAETLSVDQLFAAYEVEVAVTLPSHWACVCRCEFVDQGVPDDLENPETGGTPFYPGGTESECPKMEGKSCIGVGRGTGATLRGDLRDCEWTLVPDAK